MLVSGGVYKYESLNVKMKHLDINKMKYDHYFTYKNNLLNI